MGGRRQRRGLGEGGQGRNAGREGAQYQDETQSHHLQKPDISQRTGEGFLSPMGIRRRKNSPSGKSPFGLRPFYMSGERFSLKTRTAASGAAAGEI